jgi:hypothetical protein
MHNSVPGIDVPADQIARVEKAADPAEEAYLQTLGVCPARIGSTRRARPAHN